MKVAFIGLLLVFSLSEAAIAIDIRELVDVYPICEGDLYPICEKNTGIPYKGNSVEYRVITKPVVVQKLDLEVIKANFQDNQLEHNRLSLDLEN